MRVARTPMFRTSGRLGSLRSSDEGGSGQFQGPGEILRHHGLTRHLGRLGRLGRLFLTLTCVRAQQGVWGLIGGDEWEAGFSHVGSKQPPQPPQPPFFAGKALIGLDYPSSLSSLSTSLFIFPNLPNLPLEKKGVQPIGLKGGTTTKSSERAVS